MSYISYVHESIMLCYVGYIAGSERINLTANWSRRIYRKVSNIIRTLVGDKIVDHSDVVGASPVGAAPTTSSFST